MSLYTPASSFKSLFNLKKIRSRSRGPQTAGTPTAGPLAMAHMAQLVLRSWLLWCRDACVATFDQLNDMRPYCTITCTMSSYILYIIMTYIYLKYGLYLYKVSCHLFSINAASCYEGWEIAHPLTTKVGQHGTEREQCCLSWEIMWLFWATARLDGYCFTSAKIKQQNRHSMCEVEKTGKRKKVVWELNDEDTDSSNGTWWRIGWVDDFQPDGRGFDSRSSRHVGTLGKSFTYSCLCASAWNSDTVSVLQSEAPLSSRGLEGS